MADNRHEAVWNWLKTCPYLTDLYFNLGQVGDNTTSLIPSESVQSEFTDGSKEMLYECSLIRWFAGSFEPNDIANITKLIDFDKIAGWIDAQNASRNLPVFPSGMTVNSVSILPNQSGFIVEQNSDLAKFMIQFSIEYMKG